MIDYDPFDKAVKQDPHSWFDEMRAKCPVHHHRLQGVDLNRINANPLVARPTDEFWTVFRYEDCLNILQDAARFSSKEGPGPERLMLLCTHPEERAKLEADWSRLDTAVEEILRYDAPIEGLFRTTTEPVEIAGCPIPAGAKVRVMYAAANHDDAHFKDAGEFRIDRDPVEVRKHLAFSHGPHACIGASLARAEIGTGLRTLLRRLPGLELDPARPPVRNTSMFINGFSSVPVVRDPARALPAGL